MRIQRQIWGHCDFGEIRNFLMKPYWVDFAFDCRYEDGKWSILVRTLNLKCIGNRDIKFAMTLLVCAQSTRRNRSWYPDSWLCQSIIYGCVRVWAPSAIRPLEKGSTIFVEQMQQKQRRSRNMTGASSKGPHIPPLSSSETDSFLTFTTVTYLSGGSVMWAGFVTKLDIHTDDPTSWIISWQGQDAP